MGKKKSDSPFLPQDYSWARMVGIGLAVLSLGLAIAFVGFYLVNK